MGTSRVYVFNDPRDFPIILTFVSVKTNILIDEGGNPCIADFGLLAVVSGTLGPASYTPGGTARWMSPELIDPRRFGSKDSCPTTASDCYALGMVIYETISGHIPFQDQGDMTVLVGVLRGDLPPREDLFPDGVWKMLKQCWAPHPKKRPSIENVLHRLEGGPNVSDGTKWWRLPSFFPLSRHRLSSSTTLLSTIGESSTSSEGGSQATLCEVTNSYCSAKPFDHYLILVCSNATKD
jgi:serine/threonine protein kinase